jgi:hypothetical protein
MALRSRPGPGDEDKPSPSLYSKRLRLGFTADGEIGGPAAPVTTVAFGSIARIGKFD